MNNLLQTLLSNILTNYSGWIEETGIRLLDLSVSIRQHFIKQKKNTIFFLPFLKKVQPVVVKQSQVSAVIYFLKNTTAVALCEMLCITAMLIPKQNDIKGLCWV